MKRAIIVVAAALLFVIGASAIRAVWAGGAALDDGDAALRRGDTAAAIAHYRRAARWYVPLVGASADAFDRLERLAGDAETRGDVATARDAWTAIHTSAVAIRGATAPFDDARVRADARLAALLATPPNPSAGATVPDRTAFHQRVLASSARPTRGLLVVAALGLLLAIFGAADATLAYGPGDPAPKRARHRRGLLLFAAGAAVWLLGMLLV